MSLSINAHPDTLASSRILIVGGTSGIRAAVVSGALANGGNVHISSSNPERIAARIAEFKALYPGNSSMITGTAADLSEEDTLEDNVKHVVDEAIKALQIVTCIQEAALRENPMTFLCLASFMQIFHTKKKHRLQSGSGPVSWMQVTLCRQAD
ncbi:hypothetical protein AC579_3694 [Pseudocercospora musae]|uniref:Ketoreductase (KR) domain-containing protein n=1 Tax=Pseudocercospora musae TaxID=113226 RepID=A0A139IIN7_9PEZI|nr:hypothetical protein AC579_3694 [Pseudocercospora musae]